MITRVPVDPQSFGVVQHQLTSFRFPWTNHFRICKSCCLIDWKRWPGHFSDFDILLLLFSVLKRIKTIYAIVPKCVKLH